MGGWNVEILDDQLCFSIYLNLQCASKKKKKNNNPISRLTSTSWGAAKGENHSNVFSSISDKILLFRLNSSSVTEKWMYKLIELWELSSGCFLSASIENIVTNSTHRRWHVRKILRNLRTVSNSINKEIRKTASKRAKFSKSSWIDHIMKNEQRYELTQLILQDKIMGRIGPWRRRITWLGNLRTWFATITTEFFRAAWKTEAC